MVTLLMYYLHYVFTLFIFLILIYFGYYYLYKCYLNISFIKLFNFIVITRNVLSLYDHHF